MDLGELREQYTGLGLARGDLADDPIDQFRVWFTEVRESGYWEPNAVIVNTVDADGWPEGRNVLLKHFDNDGFVFYTNYNSAKGQAIDATGRAGMTFNWIQLRRQVQITGLAARVSEEQSDRYFATRPRGSQLGSWSSDQSTEVADREVLDTRYREIEERFAGQDVPRPPHWGGIGVEPLTIEFWQGRHNRMHDRLRYTRPDTTTPNWTIKRLAP
jgi:pyridoxamine 5'-phosphate oxidase